MWILHPHLAFPPPLTSHPTPFGPFLRDYSDSLLAFQYLSEQELLEDCSAQEGVGGEGGKRSGWYPRGKVADIVH